MLLKETALLRVLLGIRIPMIMFCAPRVVKLDEEGCDLLIPLGYRTRNHLGSMYFGALHVGADLAGGLNAARLMMKGLGGVNLVFKDCRSEFLKRADGDVLFSCRDGVRVRAAMEETTATGERVHVPVEIVATVPKKYGDEPVARFTLTLSMKRKPGREEGARS